MVYWCSSGEFFPCSSDRSENGKSGKWSGQRYFSVKTLVGEERESIAKVLGDRPAMPGCREISKLAAVNGLLRRSFGLQSHGYRSCAFGAHQTAENNPQSYLNFRQSLGTGRRFSSEVSSTEQVNLIKLLRERTSAPIKAVKSALVDCNWDIDAAQKDLRKRGVVLASKKSSRTAAEGLLAIAQSKHKAAVIELNCETDFVARNDIFQSLAASLARKVLSSESSDPIYLENENISLEHPKLNGEMTIRSAITEVAAMVGENVRFRRGFALSASSHGVVASYLHTSPQPGLGRIAGLLTLEVEDGSTALDALHEVGASLAMHVVAAKPLFLSKELVSSEAVESEREILKSQAESSGKSQMAVEKMVEGRLRKYFEEVVLTEQKFVVDDSLIVKSVLSNLSKEVGSTVKIGNFLRIEVGEGIQKLETNGS